MNDHTPGEWHSGAGLFDHIFAGYGRQTTCVAQLDSHEERSPEESLANAKLIAAAPDLLAACLKAMEWSAAWPLGGCASREDGLAAQDVYDACSAAIAKAVGA